MGTWDLAGGEQVAHGRCFSTGLHLPGPDDCPHNGTEHAITSENEGNESVRNKRSLRSTEESVTNQRNSFSTEDSLRSKRSLGVTEEADRYRRSPLSTEDTNRNK